MVCTDCPFGYVAGHVIQPVFIRCVRGNLAGIYVSVVDVVTAKRFEISQEASLVVACIGSAPWVH